MTSIFGKSFYFNNLKVGICHYIYKASVLCLTLKEYTSRQDPLDMLCKTFSVLNLPLFVMILLAVVCLIMSLLDEMFIYLSTTILTPCGQNLLLLFCVCIMGTVRMLVIMMSCWLVTQPLNN